MESAKLVKRKLSKLFAKGLESHEDDIIMILIFMKIDPKKIEKFNKKSMQFLSKRTFKRKSI